MAIHAAEVQEARYEEAHRAVEDKMANVLRTQQVKVQVSQREADAARTETRSASLLAAKIVEETPGNHRRSNVDVYGMHLFRLYIIC